MKNSYFSFEPFILPSVPFPCISNSFTSVDEMVGTEVDQVELVSATQSLTSLCMIASISTSVISTQGLLQVTSIGYTINQ